MYRSLFLLSLLSSMSSFINTWNLNVYYINFYKKYSYFQKYEGYHEALMFNLKLFKQKKTKKKKKQKKLIPISMTRKTST